MYTYCIHEYVLFTSIMFNVYIMFGYYKMYT
jgi:hypothetical protein